MEIGKAYYLSIKKGISIYLEKLLFKTKERPHQIPSNFFSVQVTLKIIPKNNHIKNAEKYAPEQVDAFYIGKYENQT